MKATAVAPPEAVGAILCAGTTEIVVMTKQIFVE